MYNKLNFIQMKRVVKFSILMAITTVALLFAGACSENDPVEKVKLESDSFNGKVTAQVASAGVTKVMAIIDPKIIDNTLHGTLYAEGSYASGGFSIDLPGIGAGDLMKVTDYVKDILKVTGGSLSYSASDAKVVDIDFFGFNAKGNAIGYYVYKSADGLTTCFFVYTDKDVDVTGGSNIAVSLKKGWNRLYQSTDKLATKAPADMSWRFVGI